MRLIKAIGITFVIYAGFSLIYVLFEVVEQPLGTIITLSLIFVIATALFYKALSI